jgi:elongation factor P
MKISGNEVKPGMLLEHKDDLWEVLKTQHVKPGKGGAFNQVEMKSVNKGTKLNERFRSSDDVEKASIDEINFNYLYENEAEYYFIDQKTFEQINIKKEIVGEKGKFLKEELEVKISFYEENPISIELPKQVQCKIESTDASLKGQTVSSSYKPAILDNGVKIQVPPFIESGDEIVVDTRSIEYVKKL